jgi:hypothetical protein
MRRITIFFVVAFVINPLLPWGLPVGGRAWWLMIVGTIGSLGRLWYVAIRDERANPPAPNRDAAPGALISND